MGVNGSKLTVCNHCATEIASSQSKEANKNETKRKTSSSSTPDLHASSGAEDEADEAVQKTQSMYDLQVPSDTLCCSRCHAIHRSSGNEDDDGKRVIVKHCHIAPFEENLLLADEKEIDEAYIIEAYLKPFFAKHDAVMVSASKRLRIQNAEFKIVGCYPPRGFIDADSTRFYLNGKYGKLAVLKFEPIKQIHLLPMQASLDTYNKVHNIATKTGNQKDEEQKQNAIVVAANAARNQKRMQLSLQPYLRGNDAAFYIDVSEVSEQHMVNGAASSPSSGHVENGRFYLSDEVLLGVAKHEHETMEESETKQAPIEDSEETLNPSVVTTSMDNDCNRSQYRHLMQGETFVSNGIGWRVMQCMPSNGYIDDNTVILSDDTSIPDIGKIVLRPIYETVPVSHRNFTPRQMKQKYLDPFFMGMSQYIGHSRQVKIGGVDFSVRSCEPNAGVLTCGTVVDYMGAAIKRQQLEQIIKMEDEEMALKLQQDMEEERRTNANNAARDNGRRRYGLHVHGWQDPLGWDLPMLEFPWNQQPPPRQPKRTGVDRDLVERLPTFRYKPPADEGNQNAENDETESETQENGGSNQCMICLEHYTAEDELRILPCFHFYHKHCVDTWLIRMSSKCPICKTSIVRRARGR